MGLKFYPFLIVKCWVFLVLSLRVHSDGSEVAVKLLRTPHPFSNRNSTTFTFQVLVGGNGNICTDCSSNCKLDYGRFYPCKGGRVSYTGLEEGHHSFEVCTTGFHGVACATYNWTVDTLNPTAHITAATSFTSASQVSVNVTFNEPCGGEGGFRCSSIKACNLLVYGPGQVVPNTLNIIQPKLKYSITVSLSERAHYGRLILVMDKDFCTDSAGNKFTRTENSSLFIHFDRRSVFVNLKTHVPERLIQINKVTRTVLATNKIKNLKVYLYFTEPVINSSAEILNTIITSQGSLVRINGNNLGKRRFGYQLTDIPEIAIITVSLHSNLVISRQGTPVTPVSPVTFLYDSQRPTVKLSTTSYIRTKEKTIPILIKFAKPVFGFNSSHISISGGHLKSFNTMTRSTYIVHIQADTDVISVIVPENETTDVSGNRNRASNTLQVRHYSVPLISFVVSTFATAAFAVASLVAMFLTVSTTNLLSIGAFSRPSSILSSDPARNLFRIIYHIQVFALSGWLAVTLPVEYYELAQGLRWSIPYFNLPWEKGNALPIMVGSNSPTDRLGHSSEMHDSIIIESVQPVPGNPDSAAKVYGLPLTPMEYNSYFESKSVMPEVDYILDPQTSHGWRDFSRSMFWLAVIGGILILLHGLLLSLLKFKGKEVQKKGYGACIFPRFEIFLVMLSVPCFCGASAAIVKGGTSSGIIVGLLILCLIAFLLLSLLLFLSIGITCGKLLQYKEVHQEDQKSHWYQEIIRVILGPGKIGQWTWKKHSHSIYLTILGPLFEDLSGPPKYMLSQIDGGGFNKRSDRIMASDDETENAEASFIQKVFGILRIYYTLLECVKRVVLGTMAGAYSRNWSSKTPSITLLCITSFQLFFVILKKPFIKKRVQFVEIVSLSSEVAIFALCVVLLDREFSAVDERKIGISMLSVFLIGFTVQMINECHALLGQIKKLDPVFNSFLQGFETALIGFIFIFCPHSFFKNLDSRFPIQNLVETGYTTTSSGDRRGSSGSRSSSDKSWMRRLRELTQTQSSLSKEGNKVTPNDPSTSKASLGGLWRSSSSAASSSVDFRSKSKGLFKELEDIFASE